MVDKTLSEISRSDVIPSIPVRVWHRLQERVRAPSRRRDTASLLAKFRPAAPANGADDPEKDAILARDGVVFYPQFISRETADELHDLLTGFEIVDPWKPQNGKFRLDSVPANTHVGDIPIAPALRALQDLALDSRLVNLAARYFGCKPYLDSIQAWWSFSGNEVAEEAENFHRDNDSIRFLKFFLYLTDVDSNCGPHKFVVRSQAEPALLERRRYTDDEVIAAFGADRILEVHGRAGDAFMEDTFGLHKGQLPRTGRRLLAQFRYSVTPSIFRSRIVVREPLAPPRKDVTSLVHTG